MSSSPRRDAETTRPTGLGVTAAVQYPRASFALLAAVQMSLISAITLLTLGLPAIAHEYGLGSTDLALLSAAYGLPFSGLLLLGGRLADVFGRRRVFTVGVAGFGGASILAAASPAFVALVAARAAQGAGAALAAPAALALVSTVHSDGGSSRRSLATWGTLASIGAIGGILLGGVIVSLGSWRWTFALPIAVAAIAARAAPRLLPADASAARTRVDLPAALVGTATVVTLSYGLLAVPGRSFWSAAVVAPLLAGLVLSFVFIAVETQSDAPLLPISLIGSGRRLYAYLALALASGGTASATFFFSLYFQQVEGFSPLRTSAAFLPYALGLLITAPVAGRFVARWGGGAMTATGLLVAACGLLMLSQLTAGGSYFGFVLAGLITLSVGASLAFAGATVTATADAPEHHRGAAGGIMNTALELGPTVGLAVLVSVAAARTSNAGQPSTGTTGYSFALALAAAAFSTAALLPALCRVINHFRLVLLETR